MDEELLGLSEYEKNELQDYGDALERLKKNKPFILPKNSSINFDNVAIEAGRGKGAIKKSRPLYTNIRAEILEEKNKKKREAEKQKTQRTQSELEIKRLKKLLGESYNREIMLANKLMLLEQDNKKLRDL